MKTKKMYVVTTVEDNDIVAVFPTKKDIADFRKNEEIPIAMFKEVFNIIKVNVYTK